MRVRPQRGALALVYTIVLYVLSSLPPSTVKVLGLSPDWVDLSHVPLFAGWTWVTLWALVGPPGVKAILVTTAALTVAVADEWLQVVIPGRVAALDDLRADALGVLIGLVLYEVMRRLSARFAGGSAG